MKRRLLALVLVVAMLMSATPMVFAEGEVDAEKTINYVSLGDSMNNGYGLEGYNGNNGVYDYGKASYANKFADWLAEESGATVNHSQLAMSAMRAEDLHWLLELNYGDKEAIDITDMSAWDAQRWYEKFSTGDYWTWKELCNDYRFASAAYSINNGGAIGQKITNGEAAIVAKTYQEAVKNADIISMGMGNGNFGVFMFGRLLESIGFGGKPSDAMVYSVERALAECDPEIQEYVLGLKEELYDLVVEYMGDTMTDSVDDKGNDDPADDEVITKEAKLKALANTIAYTGVSYVLNYAGSLEAILQLNGDAEIILVALMNTFSGDNGTDEASIGDLMDLVFVPLNAYIAGLPAVMQAMGNGVYDEATFYYAEAPYVECMVDDYVEEIKKSESIVRDRFVDSIVFDPESGKNGEVGMVWGLLGPMIGRIMLGASLEVIDLEEIENYEDLDDAAKAQFAADPSKRNTAISCAFYLAFEDAILTAVGEGTPVSLNSVLGLGALSGEVFAGVMESFQGNIESNGAAYTSTVQEVVKGFLESGQLDAKDAEATVIQLCGLMALRETLSAAIVEDTAVSGLLSLFARCIIGNGLGSHPSKDGHEALFEAVKNAYGKHTVQDETVDNVKQAIALAVKLIDEHKYEIYAGAYQYAEGKGYIDGVQSELDKLDSALTDIAAAAAGLEVSEDMKADLAAVIVELKGDVQRVKTFIDEAETLEKFEDDILEVIGEFAKDMAALEALCEQAGIDGYAALEAIYENLSACIGDICQWIYDNAYELIGEVYTDVVDCIAALAAEYGPAAEEFVRKWLIENPQIVMEKLMAYGEDIDAFINYWGRYVKLILGPAWEAYGDELTAMVEELMAALGSEAAALGEEAAAALIAYIESLDLGSQIEEIADAVKDGSIALGKNTLGELKAIVEDLNRDIETNVDAVIDALEELADGSDVKTAEAIIEATIAAVLDKESALKEQIKAIEDSIKAAEEQLKYAVAEAADLIDIPGALEEALQSPEKLGDAVDAVMSILGEVCDALEGIGEAAKTIAALTSDISNAAEDIDAALRTLHNELGIAAGEIGTTLTAAGAEAEALLGETYAAIDSFVTTTVDTVITDAAALIAACEMKVMTAVNELLAGIENALYQATHGDYEVTCQSYYVSIGDSSVTGMGANNGEHPEGYANYGYQTLVPASFPYKLAEKLGLDVEEQYIQLAMAGMRTTDLRYILDETFVPDDYAMNRNEAGRITQYAGSLEEMRADYNEALAKADLVTLSFGNCNFTDFVGTQLTGLVAETIMEDETVAAWINDPDVGDYIKATLKSYGINVDDVMYDLTWENYFDETGIRVKDETLAGIKTTMVENGVMEYYSLDVGAMIQPVIDQMINTKPGINVTLDIVLEIPVAELLCEVLETYLYAYVTYAADYAAVIDLVHEKAPEAEVMVLGLCNPTENLVFTVEGTELPVGEYLGVFLQFINAHYFGYAIANGDDTTYVDVYDAESVFEAQIADGNEFELMDYLTSFSGENSANYHATEAGHTYMAEQAYAALNVTKTGHDWTSVVTAPGCTAGGYTTYTCVKCGYSYKADESNAIGHAWGEWTDDKNGTTHTRICANDTSHVETEAHDGDNCSKCDYVKQPGYTPKPDKDEGCDGGKNCPCNAFTDLDSKQWYHEGIDYVLNEGLMNGVGNGLFAPNATTTRAMIITTLYRMEGSPAVKGELTYTDVAEGTWYTDAVIWGTEKGIIKGHEDNTYAPMGVVTREQIAAIFNRYAAYKKADTSKSADLAAYTDAGEVSAWFVDNMKWAVGSKLINGRTSTTLVPKGATTRAEMATLLYRWATELSK